MIEYGDGDPGDEELCRSQVEPMARASHGLPQEKARPLLTLGEVMQLPPMDEIVMEAGAPPIRAKKVR